MHVVQVRVDAGPQKNATMTLASGAVATVGGGDHDIALRDASLGNRVLLLQIESSAIVLKVLSGDVLVNGDDLSAGQSLRLEGEVRVVLGDTHLRLLRVLAPGLRSASIVTLAKTVEPPCATPEADNSGDTDQGDGQSAGLLETALSDTAQCDEISVADARKRVSPWVLRGGLCTLGLLLLGLTVGGWSAMRDSTERSIGQQTLATRLVAAGFDSIAVDAQARPVAVQGFLATRDESKRLDSLLRSEPVRVQNRVQVGTEVALRVQEVFRLNGVESTVSVAAAGVARVVTRSDDEAALQHIARQAQRDVPQLIDIELINTVPESAAEPAPAVHAIPGKRVAMVVSDAPAHVITEDRSRYFVGSLLPTGHRITAINAGTVSLIKAGERTDMVF